MINITKKQPEYELLDSGDGEKLERFGSTLLRRPDPQALWPKKDPTRWQNAHASFVRVGNTGKWQFKKDVSKEWNISFGNLMFKITPTPFKHTGLFPEQLSNWQWAEDKIRHHLKNTPHNPPRVLNLFGYTGGMSLVCALAGAEVCHVDASKSALTWARHNADLSDLSQKPIRWILDDAFEFVRKEIKRGKKYDAIVMDPPAFGHGPNGEVWKIEHAFIDFVSSVKQLLSDMPLFIIINGYSAGYSSIAYAQNLDDVVTRFGGSCEHGELLIEEQSGRMLPSGICARWSRF